MAYLTFWRTEELTHFNVFATLVLKRLLICQFCGLGLPTKSSGILICTDLIFAGIDLAIIDVDLTVRPRVAGLRRPDSDRGIESNFYRSIQKIPF
jgi:hypothetical protein